MCVCACVCVCLCLSSLVCMVGVIFVYADTVIWVLSCCCFGGFFNA